MKFNRFYLVSSINQSKKDNKPDIYIELMYVLYKLLEQEQIYSRFIVEFVFYEAISSQAIRYYSNCCNNSL